MRIVGLTTARFRNLPDRLWPFVPGFQIIRGPNEAGKSALHEAIRISLFASATSQDQRYALACRWGSPDPIRLALHVQADGGTFQIVRDFAARKNQLIRPDGTLRPEADLTAFLQQHLRIPTEAAFLATACVEQDELIRVRREGRALQPLLEQHALGGTPVNIADLVKQLEKRLVELRRGLERGAPRNPGPLRRHTDAIDGLRAELAALREKAARQADAAAALVDVQAQLQAARTEVRTAREHLARHAALTAAEEQQRTAEERLRRTVERLGQLTALEAAIPRLREEHAQAVQTCSDHRTRTERGEEHARLTDEIERMEEELTGLVADQEALATLDRSMAELTAERRGLPLTLDDLANLRALPGEIAGLAQTVEGADRHRAEQTDRRAAAEQERTVAQELHAELTAERAARAEALAQASAHRDSQRTLEDLEARLGTLMGRLGRIRPLAADLEGKREERAALAPLDPLGAFLPTLRTQIATYQQALAGQFIEAEVRPRQPLDLTTQIDNEAPEHREGTEPVTLRATRRIEMALAPWAEITIRNQSEAAHTLARLEAQRDALLAAAECASVAEAEARLAARAALDAEIVEVDRHLLAELGRDTLAALEEEARTLCRAHEAAREAHAALPVAAEDPEAIEGNLNLLLREITEAERTIGARTTEIATLARALAADPVAPVRAEIQRKQQALEALQARLGAETDPEHVEASHRRLVAELEIVQASRDSTLDGRLPATLERRAAALRELLAERGPHRDALTADAVPPEALAAAKAALPGLTRAADEANEALQTALAQRAALDQATLEQEQMAAVVAITAAKGIIAANGDFRLAPPARLTLEARVQDLDLAIPALEKQAGALEERAGAEADLQEQIAQREERLAAEERQLRGWTTRVNVDTQITALLQAARTQAVADLADRILPATTGRYLARVTGRRHGDVRYADGAYQVWAAAKGAALTDEEFSGGTRDQFYLALRLAHLEALYAADRPPLLLDDPLVHCDPDRRSAMLQVLAEYTEHGQVLLFTCHDFPQYEPYATLTVAEEA